MTPDAKGGPVATLCEAKSGRGGSWNRDGVIVFAPSLKGELERVSSNGGQPVRVTPPGGNRWPWFLPDGKRFLYIGGTDLLAGSLDDPNLRRMVLTGVVPRQLISGITRDNQRFLFRLGTEQGLPPINVVMNWRKALQER